jgi:outer membrane biosynthesis protein TonB
MIERPGPSFLLSLVVVAVAALILYRPEAEPPVEAEVASPEPPPQAAGPPADPSPEPVPEPTPGVAWNAGVDPSPAAPSPDQTPPSTPTVRPASARRAIDAPFATAESGETLAGLARGVSGTVAARGFLWDVNRDVVPDPDAPLWAGAVHRTPKRP